MLWKISNGFAPFVGFLRENFALTLITTFNRPENIFKLYRSLFEAQYILQHESPSLHTTSPVGAANIYSKKYWFWNPDDLQFSKIVECALQLQIFRCLEINRTYLDLLQVQRVVRCSCFRLSMQRRSGLTFQGFTNFTAEQFIAKCHAVNLCKNPISSACTCGSTLSVITYNSIKTKKVFTKSSCSCLILDAFVKGLIHFQSEMKLRYRQGQQYKLIDFVT